MDAVKRVIDLFKGIHPCAIKFIAYGNPVDVKGAFTLHLDGFCLGIGSAGWIIRKRCSSFLGSRAGDYYPKEKAKRNEIFSHGFHRIEFGLN